MKEQDQKNKISNRHSKKKERKTKYYYYLDAGITCVINEFVLIIIAF
jgi:hypothetical protein